MGNLRFANSQTRPTERRDLPSLTVQECRELVSPFEGAFPAHMTPWRLDGPPRIARRYTPSTTCPLPTPEERLLVILVELKTYALQVVQGRLFGMGRSKAQQWIHGLLIVRRSTLRTLRDAPTRALTALAQRLGVAEAAAAALVEPTEESSPVALATAPAAGPASPRSAPRGPNGASSAPRIQLRRRAVIAASKSATRSTTGS